MLAIPVSERNVHFRRGSCEPRWSDSLRIGFDLNIQAREYSLKNGKFGSPE